MEEDVRAGLVLPGDAEVTGGVELGEELVDHDSDSRATAATSSLSGRRSRYSSRSVRMQLGSVPTMGMPCRAYGASTSTLRKASLRASVDETLGEHRPAATDAALLDDDLEAGGFQQLHGADADARIVVLGEGVVEIDDLAPR